MKKSIISIFILLFLSTSPACSNGIELSVTFTGKLFLGLGYRLNIDSNTALRLAVSAAVNGAPVVINSALLQDVSPSDSWTPYFGVGADAIFFKRNNNISQVIFPTGTVGFSYCPKNIMRHNAELDLALFTRNYTFKPISIKYIYYNSVL